MYLNNLKIETVPFIITSKRIKYLGIHLTKEMKSYTLKNYKILLKEIKDLNKK